MKCLSCGYEWKPRQEKPIQCPRCKRPLPSEIVIVSRHPATIEFLKEKLPNAKVIEHLNGPDDISFGALVFGNLPLHMVEQLLQKGCRFIMVSLNIPRELRGKELSREELEKYIELYEIRRLKLEKFILN